MGTRNRFLIQQIQQYMEKPDLMIDGGITYLNHAAIGPLPQQAYEILTQVYYGLASKGEGGLDFEGAIKNWDETRESVARLINGKPEGVTVTTNTASGLHIVADGLYKRLRNGGNIVITELEFTTNSFVWQKVALRYNLELRVVGYDKTKKQFHKWEDYIDRKTRLVSLSHVQFSNGYRTPLKPLVEYAHDAGALVNLDSIQALGVVPFDVTDTGVDFLSAGGYKWLMGPLGTGIFYTNPDLLDELDSVLTGWFSSKNFHEMTHNPYNQWDDARRFQQSLNPAMEALRTSIEMIIEWDPAKTLSHVNKLHDIILESISTKNAYSNRTNIDNGHRSGILTLAHENAEKIVEELKENLIYVALRDGAIRIAPHHHNTEEEIEKFTSFL